jgi:hypothetical protein
MRFLALGSPPGLPSAPSSRGGLNERVVTMETANWLEELDTLERELALRFWTVRQREGRDQVIALRLLLDTLADLRALVYSRIDELGAAEEFWSYGEDT